MRSWLWSSPTRAYLIETGRIVTSGTPAEIASNEDIRKSYLGY